MYIEHVYCSILSSKAIWTQEAISDKTLRNLLLKSTSPIPLTILFIFLLINVYIKYLLSQSIRFIFKANS